MNSDSSQIEAIRIPAGLYCDNYIDHALVMTGTGFIEETELGIGNIEHVAA